MTLLLLAQTLLILSEPDVAYDRTKLAIEKALKENRAKRDKERECCEI